MGGASVKIHMINVYNTSLRRHYPDQVIRVFRLGLNSQQKLPQYWLIELIIV